MSDKTDIERLAGAMGIHLSLTVRPGFIARIGAYEAQGDTESEATVTLKSRLAHDLRGMVGDAVDQMMYFGAKTDGAQQRIDAMRAALRSTETP